MDRSRTGARHIAILALIAAAACHPGAPIREAVRPTSPHEQYAQSLRDAGLDDTALGAGVAGAADSAVARPTESPSRSRSARPAIFAGDEARGHRLSRRAARRGSG
jgi:hypothetical protein